ncbi:AMP-binding protein [Pikeienuella sp. HZG-20]|uniref:AMP-binding protein n=1 Tax=Paludibacillus litoralis TaxID=3133267 RepID=UPI0030EE79D5
MQIEFDSDVKTVGECLRQQAQATPERVAIDMIGEASETFSDCHQRSLAFARAFIAAGLAMGETAVVMAPNCLTAIHAWLGANLAGVVDVTINTAYRGRVLEHAVNTANAKILIAEAGFLPVLRESEANLPALERIVWFRVGSDPAPASVPDFKRIEIVALDAFLAAGAQGDFDLPTVRMSDIASVIYTSGTTGPAKGVMMPHAQVCALARQSVEGLRLGPDDVFYCFHPLFHMAGRFMAVFATMMAGGRVVIDTTFKAALWVDRVRACGATVGLAHGPMIEMIFAEPPRAEDSDHAVTRLLAAPFPKAIAEAFEERFHLRGIEVWGMTEVNIGAWRPIDEPLRLGSCGRVSDKWVELKIVDPDTDIECEVGTPGEIVVRPRHPFVFMSGYLGMPEKTVEAWRNLWFHSGDIGYLDAEGYCYFVDRRGDHIRRRAENIASYDIESAAMAHPAVAECAAVGVPSEFAGDDDIKLCLVPRPGRTAAPEAVLTHLAGCLPHYMVPRYIETLDQLPRTPTNKIRKAELRERGVSPQTWDRKAAGIVLRELIAATRAAKADA